MAYCRKAKSYYYGSSGSVLLTTPPAETTCYRTTLVAWCSTSRSDSAVQLDNNKKMVKCGACRSEGHTKRTCPLEILYRAAEGGNAQQVATLLADGADANFVNNVGTPAPRMTHAGTSNINKNMRELSSNLLCYPIPKRKYCVLDFLFHSLFGVRCGWNVGCMTCCSYPVRVEKEHQADANYTNIVGTPPHARLTLAQAIKQATIEL